MFTWKEGSLLVIMWCYARVRLWEQDTIYWVKMTCLARLMVCRYDSLQAFLERIFSKEKKVRVQSSMISTKTALPETCDINHAMGHGPAPLQGPLAGSLRVQTRISWLSLSYNIMQRKTPFWKNPLLESLIWQSSNLLNILKKIKEVSVYVCVCGGTPGMSGERVSCGPRTAQFSGYFLSQFWLDWSGH